MEEGGADMILVYNSGRYRMAGRGSLAGMMPYGDANETVLNMVGLCAILGYPPPSIALPLLYGQDTMSHLPRLSSLLTAFSGGRNPQHRHSHPRPRWRLRHRPLSPHPFLPAPTPIPRFLRYPELSHSRPHRRHLPRQPRSHRDVV